VSMGRSSTGDWDGRRDLVSNSSGEVPSGGPEKVENE
jgi:hypothetical protein